MPSEKEIRERIKDACDEARKDERWKVNIEWETWLNKKTRNKIIASILSLAGTFIGALAFYLIPKLIEGFGS